MKENIYNYVKEQHFLKKNESVKFYRLIKKRKDKIIIL